MTNRIDTLIQRATAIAMASVVTLAMLGGIDALARGEHGAGALMAQQPAAQRA